MSSRSSGPIAASAVGVGLLGVAVAIIAGINVVTACRGDEELVYGDGCVGQIQTGVGVGIVAIAITLGALLILCTELLRYRSSSVMPARGRDQ